MTCPLLSVHDQFSAQKEEYKKKRRNSHIWNKWSFYFNISTKFLSGWQYWSPPADLKGVRKQSMWLGNWASKRLSKQHFQDVGHGSQGNEQIQLDHNPTDERPIPFPSRSGWKISSKAGGLRVWELRGDKSLDLSIPVGIGSYNQNSHNISTYKGSGATMQKLSELPELDMLKSNNR